MSGRTRRHARSGDLLGGYVPGTGWMHRLPVLWFLAGIALLSIVTMVVRSPWLTLGLFAALVVAGLSAGLGLRVVLRPLRTIWVVLLVIVVVQVWLAGPVVAARVVGIMVACVTAAGLLMVTHPVAELLDAFTRLARPVRFVGVDPARVGLAGMLMVRSIPHIAHLMSTSRDAARARGLERSIRARTVPVVLGTVAYAHETAHALDARGLGEESTVTLREEEGAASPRRPRR